MEQPSPKIDHDAILVEAARRYNIKVDHLQPLMVDEDTHVYAYAHAGRGFVLKWTTSAEKSAEAISAELDWVNYLADHGAPVCRAVPSPRGKLVEVIAAGDGYVSVAAQERAEGQRPAGSALNAGLFRTWGHVMGRMHALAKQYRPVGSFAIRSWHQSEHLVRAYIPADQTLVLTR